MSKEKINISVILSVLAAVVSIIGIVFITYKSDANIKFNSIFFGLLGSVVGAVLSLILMKAVKKKPTTKVFISFSNNDKDVADKLTASLNEKHIRVYKEDETVEIGIDFQKQIRELIKDVDIVIILLSKDYYKSKNIKRVIDVSKSMHKKILPITTDNSELPGNVSNLQYFDTSENLNKTADEIIERVMHMENS